MTPLDREYEAILAEADRGEYEEVLWEHGSPGQADYPHYRKEGRPQHWGRRARRTPVEGVTDLVVGVKNYLMPPKTFDLAKHRKGLVRAVDLDGRTWWVQPSAVPGVWSHSAAKMKKQHAGRAKTPIGVGAHYTAHRKKT